MQVPNLLKLRPLLVIAAQAFVVSHAVAQFGLPEKPVHRHPRALLLDAPKVDMDYVVTDGDETEIAKEVTKRSLKSKELSGLTFYYSEKTLNIDDTKRQTRLLNECVDVLAADPLRIVPLSKLSLDSQAILRGLLSSSGTDDRLHKAAFASEVTMLAGISSSGTFRLGGLSAKFQTIPHNTVEEMNELLTTSPSKDFPVTLPYTSSQIAFLFGLTIPPESRLKYLHAIQDFLKSECMQAKQAFEKASIKAQNSIYGPYATEYDHLLSLEGHPKFKDFNAEDQKTILANLKPGPGPDIADVKQFLAKASAENFHTDFTLTLFVKADTKIIRQDIHFVCPIGP